MELFSGIPDPSLLIFYPSLPVFANLCLLFQKWQRWPVKCTGVFASAPRDARGSMELFSGIPDPSLLIFYPSLPVFAYLCLLFQKWQRWPVKCTRVFASAPRDARGSIELFSGIPGPSLLHFYPSFHFFSYRQRKFTELFYATLYIVVLW